MADEKNMVGWFEIPVSDMERAMTFYEKVFDVTLSRNKIKEVDMAWFPYVKDGNGSAGTLVHNEEFYTPSQSGVLVYFMSRGDDLTVELSRVEEAGGKVLVEKTAISDEHGFMAVFEDTEGNRVALHSMK